MPAEIRIEGLRDLQKALKELDGESQKLLRVKLNEAAETVAGGARRRMPTKTGKAKASVKVASSQREARVKAGGRRAPYVPFLEYGNKVGGGKGAVGRRDSVPRKYAPGGRYLYPTYFANRESIMKGLAKSLAELIEQAGLNVEEG